MKRTLPAFVFVGLTLIGLYACKKDKELSNLSGISSFAIKDFEAYTFTIDQTALTISNVDSLPYQTDPAALIAVFSEIPGSVVRVNGTVQESGVTPNDFTNEVAYQTTAEDGVTVRSYRVKVNIAQVDPNTVAWTRVTNSGAWAGYQSLEAGFFKDKFWVYSTKYGANGTFSSADGVTWETITIGDDGDSGLLFARQTAVFGFNDNIWLLGGLKSFAWNPTNSVWNTADGINFTLHETGGDSRWSVRERINAVVFDGKLWVVGGNAYPSFGNLNATGTPYNDVWNSTDGITWSQVTEGAAFTARSNPALFVHNDKLYLIGGLAGSTYYNEIWTSEDGIAWTQLNVETPFTGRMGSAGISFKGQLFLIGGRTAAGITGVSNEIWVSEDDGINWIKVESGDPRALPGLYEGRVYPRVFEHDDALYIIGGEYQSEDGAYSQRTDVWKGVFVKPQDE